MKLISSILLALGVLVLVQGAIAFFLRVNILTGTKYGPSLTPVYIIFSGIAICVIGLTLRALLSQRKK